MQLKCRRKSAWSKSAAIYKLGGGARKILDPFVPGSSLLVMSSYDDHDSSRIFLIITDQFNRGRRVFAAKNRIKRAFRIHASTTRKRQKPCMGLLKLGLGRAGINQLSCKVGPGPVKEPLKLRLGRAGINELSCKVGPGPVMGPLKLCLGRAGINELSCKVGPGPGMLESKPGACLYEMSLTTVPMTSE